MTSETMAESNKIFPLIDRKTPVLDRIRNRNKLRDDDMTVSQMVIKISSIDDPEEKEEAINQAENMFLSRLADEAGIDESLVNDDIVEEFGNFLNNSVGDIVSEEGMEQLGLDLLGQNSDGEESKEEKEEEEVESEGPFQS